ncbi:fluoride efflux transporter FluC [Niallia sp. MER TA 168]|uniref:fluoride efflux transporter FluC n=1 Tax=Niallia sp. MER TA 168 TaxID=2939568 RepID=UPI00203EAD79|nr:CrcB family protein [Niallia sp. MER TA 168]MCM3365046.1 CrcB family protein [Niallia sp. MER TA 168]
MLNNLLLIGLGAFLGAISRFALINELKKRIQSSIPIPTMIVNISGSFLLGLLVGLKVYTSIYFIMAVGFLGAYTTFSALAVEAVTLMREKKNGAFFLYSLGTFFGGILFCLAGWKLALIL